MSPRNAKNEAGPHAVGGADSLILHRWENADEDGLCDEGVCVCMCCVCSESIHRRSALSLKVRGGHTGAGQQRTTQPPDDALSPVTTCESEGL